MSRTRQAFEKIRRIWPGLRFSAVRRWVGERRSKMLARWRKK
jgi:hypothetical protein